MQIRNLDLCLSYVRNISTYQDAMDTDWEIAVKLVKFHILNFNFFTHRGNIYFSINLPIDTCNENLIYLNWNYCSTVFISILIYFWIKPNIQNIFLNIVSACLLTEVYKCFYLDNYKIFLYTIWESVIWDMCCK